MGEIRPLTRLRVCQLFGQTFVRDNSFCVSPASGQIIASSFGQPSDKKGILSEGCPKLLAFLFHFYMKIPRYTAKFYFYRL